MSVREYWFAPSLALLLLLTACNAGRGGDATTALSSTGTAWLVDVTSETGVDVVHDPRAGGALRLPEIMGSGLALFDYDGDGDVDLYLVDGGRNRLFRQTSAWRFDDVTEESGLGDPGWGMGATVGDSDGDGDLDVYVTNVGADRLYRNRGDGTFEAAGVEVEGWSSSATFCDFDGDDRPDLYVARYVVDEPERSCSNAAGRHDYCDPQGFRPLHDVLLRNAGGGRFEDVSERAGLTAGPARGLGVICADFDGDRRPDFYVANDGDANQLWINQGDGTFVDQARLRGVAYSLEGHAEAGMGVVAADLDAGSGLDLFVTNLEAQSNTLYGALGGGLGFEDRTAAAGLALDSLPYTGFGVVAQDLDLDGDVDVAVANGRVYLDERRVAAARSVWDLYAEPNRLYLNDGHGRFEVDAVHGAGLTTALEVSRGLAAADIDDDGDVDLVVTGAAARARLLRNDTPAGRHWLRVVPRLDDGGDAVSAAIVRVEACGSTQTRLVARSVGYLSSGDPGAHFGFGSRACPATIHVQWPHGAEERFEVETTDRTVVVVRGRGA